MKRSRLKLGAVALVCVALGTGAGVIANSSASTTAPAHGGRAHARGAHAGRARIGKLARRTVQGTFVVHSKKGWATVSFARGTIESVSGNQLTLAEGTRKATYKTVNLTLPSKLLVRDNGKRTTLSGVSQGQRALVVIAPQRAMVVARTPKTP